MNVKIHVYLMKPKGAWEEKSLGNTRAHVTVPVTNQTFAEKPFFCKSKNKSRG